MLSQIKQKFIGVHTLRTKFNDKSDDRIEIHDIKSNFETIRGSNIKSKLTIPCTPINAGKTTNFIYEIAGDIDDIFAKEFNSSFNKMCDGHTAL